MKIGVYFHSQGEGLAVCLRALLPDAHIAWVPAMGGLAAAEHAARHAVLAGCDTIVTGNFGAGHGALATQALRLLGKPVHVLPFFSFAGLHPDVTTVRVQGRALASPTGGYQSRIAILGFLAGLSVPATEALYNRLVFARLGYLDAYGVHAQLMAERWARDGVVLAPLLARWRQSGCFAYTPNHPKIAVLLDLARIACALMGLASAVVEVDPGGLDDALGRASQHPVFPEIAAAIGVAPEGSFSPGLDLHTGARIVLSPAAFLHESFLHFSGAPEASLLATPGVAEGLDALGVCLAARPSGRRPRTAAMVLMTYHGSVVQRGAAPGQFLHRAVAAATQDSPFVVVDCSAPSVAQATGGLAGAVVRNVDLSLLVHVTRDGRYFCAERDREIAGFSRQEASDWEGFLPLAPEDLAVLQHIVATGWTLVATGEHVSRMLIRTADRFSLQFGRWRIDLRRDFPQLAPGEGGDAALTLMLDGEAHRLVPAQELPEAAPHAAGLLSPGRRLVLAGPDAWLPPPVTAGDTERAWLYHAVRDKAALNGRARATGAALRRAVDVVLVDQAPGDASLDDEAREGGKPQGRIPGVSVRFCEAWDGEDAFANAALRLHVLSAAAPADAVYLLPDTLPEALFQGLVSLQFGQLKFVRLPAASVVMAADLIWMDHPAPMPGSAHPWTDLPADALAGPRGRAGIARVGERRLVWPDGLAPAIVSALVAEGFEPVAPGLVPLALAGLLAQAGWVAGASGRLKLLFCPPGARVVEFCGEAAFAVDDWMMAAKLRLMHGVVPCTVQAGVFAADAGRLTRLLRVMAARG